MCRFREIYWKKRISFPPRSGDFSFVIKCDITWKKSDKLLKKTAIFLLIPPKCRLFFHLLPLINFVTPKFPTLTLSQPVWLWCRVGCEDKSANRSIRKSLAFRTVSWATRWVTRPEGPFRGHNLTLYFTTPTPTPKTDSNGDAGIEDPIPHLRKV